jgi:hypothetical protein
LDKILLASGARIGPALTLSAELRCVAISLVLTETSTGTLFDKSIRIPGHDITLRLLEDILEDYQKACYATGKRVEQPHLKDAAKKAIQALSPFYLILTRFVLGAIRKPELYRPDPRR